MEEIAKFAADFLRMKKSAIVIIALLVLLFPMRLNAQLAERYEKMVSEGEQRAIIEHLCDSIMEGRGSGTPGGRAAGKYISDYFKRLELKPFYYKTDQVFWQKGGINVHNIMGVVPALQPSDEYVVVCAHYDHLGKIKGRVFPGADDNASGVAALLTIADMFSQMRRDSVGPGVNILFVAFDGKEYSMAGSKHFCQLREVKRLTKTMYKLGDHYPFSQRGIPALLFTSGFHQHTLKTSDTPDIIDHKVLAKRTRLIFDVIQALAR